MLPSTFFALLIGASFATCGIAPVQVRKRSDSRHHLSQRYVNSRQTGQTGGFAFSVPPRPLPQPSVHRSQYYNNPGWMVSFFVCRRSGFLYSNLIPPVPYSIPPASQSIPNERSVVVPGVGRRALQQNTSKSLFLAQRKQIADGEIGASRLVVIMLPTPT